jgi:uncharacterized protein (DUF3820 family)
MPFGEHRGTILRKVPASYLLSLTAGDLAHYPELAAYIKRGLSILKAEAKEEAEMEANDE